MEREINYSVTEQEGIKIVKLSGSISNSTNQEIEKLVNGLTQKNNVILNMREINVITSGGLTSLVNVSVDARKRRKHVMIMNLREGLIKTIEVMGVLQYFIFIDSIEEGFSRV